MPNIAKSPAFPIPEPQLSTPVEAQKILRISRGHFYNLVNAGKIKTIRLGCAVRVPNDEIERIRREGC